MFLGVIVMTPQKKSTEMKSTPNRAKKKSLHTHAHKQKKMGRMKKKKIMQQASWNCIGTPNNSDKNMINSKNGREKRLQ